MGKTVEIGLSGFQSANTSGCGTNYVVQTPLGFIYLVYIGSAATVSFKKSLDGGLTWTEETTISGSTTPTAISVWYDRWSNISAGLIHCAYTDSTADDTFYRTIDTENSDALSTQTVIFAGATTASSGGMLSITRARGGNVYCRTCIDNGAEGGFFRLPNANVPNGAWDAARTINEAVASTDMMILLPGWAADNQDIMGIFWDASADEISRQVYDDSANSWAETSIATTMVEAAATTAFPHFSAFVDITNSKNVVAAWSGVDTANADLRCWSVTESAITETSTNIVLNGTDDQGLCAIAIDTSTGYWWAFYAGKSDGSETWNSAVHLYAKVSTDSGATWSSEMQLTNNSTNQAALYTAPRFFGPPMLFVRRTVGGIAMFIRDVSGPSASHQLLGG